MDWGSGLTAAASAMAVVHALAWPLLMATIPCQIIFLLARRGTKVRYVAKSVYRLTMIGAMVAMAASATQKLLEGDYQWSVFNWFFFAVWCWNWHMFHKQHGDDDDFWKSGKKAMKRLGARLRAGARQLAPQGA